MTVLEMRLEAHWLCGSYRVEGHESGQAGLDTIGKAAYGGDVEEEHLTNYRLSQSGGVSHVVVAQCSVELTGTLIEIRGQKGVAKSWRKAIEGSG